MAANNKKTETGNAGVLILIGFIFLAVGALTLISLIGQMSSELFQFLSGVCYGAAGSLALGVSVFFLWLGLICAFSAGRSVSKKSFLLLSLIYLCVLAIINLQSRVNTLLSFPDYIVSYNQTIQPVPNPESYGSVLSGAFRICSQQKMGGGLLGMLLGFPFWKLGGVTLGTVLLGMLVFVLAIVLLGIDVKGIAEKLQHKSELHSQEKELRRQEKEHQERLQEAERRRLENDAKLRTPAYQRRTQPITGQNAPLAEQVVDYGAQLPPWLQTRAPQGQEGQQAAAPQQEQPSMYDEVVTDRPAPLLHRLMDRLIPRGGEQAKPEKENPLTSAEEANQREIDACRARILGSEAAARAMNIPVRSPLFGAEASPANPYARPAEDMRTDENPANPYARPAETVQGGENPYTVQNRPAEAYPYAHPAETARGGENPYIVQNRSAEAQTYVKSASETASQVFYDDETEIAGQALSSETVQNPYARPSGRESIRTARTAEKPEMAAPQTVAEAMPVENAYDRPYMAEQAEQNSYHSMQTVLDRTVTDRIASYGGNAQDAASGRANAGNTEQPSFNRINVFAHPRAAEETAQNNSHTAQTVSERAARPSPDLNERQSVNPYARVLQPDPPTDRTGISARENPSAGWAPPSKPSQAGAQSGVSAAEPKPSLSANPIQARTASSSSEKDSHQPSLEKKTAFSPPQSYIPPKNDLLNASFAVERGSSSEEDWAKARQLEATLKSFGIPARVERVTHGPAVTRFELGLTASGINVKRIQNLDGNIAMDMASNGGVRIEIPIPGTNLFGIEVPHTEVESVTLSEVLFSEEMKKAKSPLTVAIGKDISGKPVLCDLAKMPHLLIAGQTGSGKSVCINAIINSIIYRVSPEDVRFIMVDPKVVELQCYNGIPHLLAPVVSDPHKAAGILTWVVGEMLDRYHKMTAKGVREISAYNAKLEPDEPKLPRIVVIIDELSDLMMACRKDIEDKIIRIAQLSRAAGIHMVLATQRPTVDVITGLIKANVPSRIAFSVASAIDSRTILDQNGAEKLLGRGDMFYFPTGIKSPIRVQGCFLSDAEIERIVSDVKSHAHCEYDQSVVDAGENAAEKGGEDGISPFEAGDTEGVDPRLPEAIQLVMESNLASISMLQRRMKIGHPRAGSLMDAMAERGIVSHDTGSKPREILITREEYERIKDSLL